MPDLDVQRDRRGILRRRESRREHPAQALFDQPPIVMHGDLLKDGFRFDGIRARNLIQP